MRILLITGARDSQLWYAQLVGQRLPLLGTWPGEGYRSREPAGYTNIVYFEDAVVEDVPS